MIFYSRLTRDPHRLILNSPYAKTRRHTIHRIKKLWFSFQMFVLLKENPCRNIYDISNRNFSFVLSLCLFI